MRRKKKKKRVDGGRKRWDVASREVGTATGQNKREVANDLEKKREKLLSFYRITEF